MADGRTYVFSEIDCIIVNDGRMNEKGESSILPSTLLQGA